MSRVLFIHSTLAPTALQECLRQYEAVHAAYAGEHEGEDDCGEATVGSYKPLEPVDIPEAIVARLAACQASLVIQDPGDETLGLQGAALAYLLSLAAPCVMDWGSDYDLGEDALTELTRRREGLRLLSFARRNERAARPVRTRAAKRGELETIAIMRALDAMGDDPDMMIDVREAIEGLDATAQAVFAALLSEDVHSVRRLAVMCTKTEAEVERALASLVEMLGSIRRG